jgi:hypothetical protein
VKGRHNWIVSFKSGDAVNEAVEGAAKNLKNMVRFGSVGNHIHIGFLLMNRPLTRCLFLDIDGQAELAKKYGVTTPTIKTFSWGGADPKDFEGEVTTQVSY